MIQHIVLFNAKSDLSMASRGLFAQTALGVLRRSPHLGRFTVGRRVALDAGYERSFGDKTYEYAAVLEFANAEALIGYLNSADHGELGRLFWEMCESTVVTEVEVEVSSANLG